MPAWMAAAQHGDIPRRGRSNGDALNAACVLCDWRSDYMLRHGSGDSATMAAVHAYMCICCGAGAS